MSRGAHSFKLSDATRAVKALLLAGARGQVEIPVNNGRRILIKVSAPEVLDEKQRKDEWD
jgi:hypothetical protein